MQLTHKIALIPTQEQADYFKKAAGTSRFVWNWGLNKWNEHYQAGQKPNAMGLKKQFNAIKYQEFPWLKDMHRDSHAQPFAYLAKAWNRFFKEIKSSKPAHQPKFKKKNHSRDSFYVANDKFYVNETTIRLPKIGIVNMTEKLRFEGKIIGATISRTANKWFVAIQVEVPDVQVKQKRVSHHIVGVDFGINAVATLSTGEKITSPKPLKSALRRLQIRSRSISRKIEAAKEIKKKQVNQPNDQRLPLSNNQKKSALKLSKLHAHIVHLRVDFTHKLTTRLCRENQAIVIENLNVAGMLKNEKLARSISDIGFGTIRRQLEYKAKRYDTELIVADRWYASTKLCSQCDYKNELLQLSDRYWTCPNCKVFHDRDINAAINLKGLATKTALPVASSSAMNDTEIGITSISGGKVTPVRHECGLEDASGQE